MSSRLIFLFTLFFAFVCGQQKNYVLKDVATGKIYLKKDSLQAAKFLDSLSQNNFYFTKIQNISEDENSIIVDFDKGKNYNYALVTVSDTISNDLKLKKSFLTKNLDSLRKKINKDYINKGYTFSRVKTNFKNFQNGTPEILLTVFLGNVRKIDGFVVKGYDNIPKKFLKNLNRDYHNKIYDEQALISIRTSLKNHPFFSVDRAPQTLFTKDSTQIFLFLNRRKSNTINGIIGFGNDKSKKFTFNGTLDASFKNIFNGFEAIDLNWQRNPDKGQTFSLATDIPYLFKSDLGLNASVNILKQDSTFANIQFRPGLYYKLSPFQKVGLRGYIENSTVTDTLYTQAKDFSKKGGGLWYRFERPSRIPLFLYTTKLSVEADLIRSYFNKQDITAVQKRYVIFGENNFHLKGNNYLNIKFESAFLDGKEELSENELFRIGGWNSLRGFNENSILSNFYIYGGGEYRYVVNDQAFFDAFAQMGRFKNIQKINVYSFGFGFNFFVPIGLMSFQISSGTRFGSPLDYKDVKIHWGIVSKF